MNTEMPDPINQLDGWYAKLTNGPMHRFTFATGTGFTGLEAEKLLRQYGVRIWGREMHNQDERAFLVKKSQAVWAEYVLCRAGAPLTCKLLDPRNAEYRERHPDGSLPIPWTGKGIGAHSFVDRVVDTVDRMLGGKG